ncbi:MAG: diaminopimelate decarboxylase [Dethiobacteria bacterium]|nr:diaminopimelate decarboxylase [Bacillota bacterium]
MFFSGTMRISDEGHLLIGGCDLVKLASEYGTPLYVYDEELIRKKCRLYKNAFAKEYPNAEVVYAGKAFLTTAMCRLVDEEGLALDVVSGGELYTALEAGFPVSRIYFHGNNKTEEELDLALEVGVGRIVADSLMELEFLDEIARQKGKEVDLYLRVKPGIKAHTHHYIQTGQEDSKFGLGISDGQVLAAVDFVCSRKRLNLKGLHCHIGSQILNPKPFRLAARVMMKLIAEIKSKKGILLNELNLGGGLGIRYTSADEPCDFDSFIRLLAETVRQEAGEMNLPLPKLMIEPGRSIVGEAGVTLYRVGTIKDIPNIRRYVSVDGGMTDNLRPALYEAEYVALVANKASAAAKEVVTIAGKNCESGDILIKDIKLPELEKGDILAVLSTGAYHYSMANNYNRNPRPAVVFVRDGRADLVVKRESWRDLVRLDCMPERFKKYQNPV